MEHRFSRVLTMVQARAISHVVVRCEQHCVERDVVEQELEGHDPVEHGAEGAEAELDSADVVSVVLSECPADVSEWMLVDLAAASGGTVVVETQGCPTASTSVQQLAPNARALEDLAQLTGGRVRPGWVAAKPVVSLFVSHPPMSRRGILARRPPAPVVAHASEDPRARLVESLRALGGDEIQGRAPALELTADGCIACGVCVQACPQDSLELGTAGGRTTLVQHPDRCQGDRACVVACPSQVISVRGNHEWTTVLAGHPLPLARLATTTCSRCQILIPQGSTMCQACAERAQDPFGVHLPPHLIDTLPAKYRDRLKG